MKVALDAIQNATDMDLPGIVHHHLRLWVVAAHKVGLLDESSGITDSIDALDSTLRQIELGQDIASGRLASHGRYRTGEKPITFPTAGTSRRQT